MYTSAMRTKGKEEEKKKPRGAGDKKVCGGRQWREPHHQQKEMTRDTRRLCHCLYCRCCCCRRPSFLKRWKRPKGVETRRRLATSGQKEKERKSERHAPCTRTKQQPISAPLPPLVLFIFLCVCRQRRIDSTIKVHHHPPTHPPPSLLKALLK